MKNYSIWQDNIFTNHYPKLEEDKIVDVLIIGGGITGISSLYHLRNSNLKVILVEEGKIGMSTTSRSTGKLTFLQNDLIDKIRISSGDDVAMKYVVAQKVAINKILKTIEKEHIKCDLKKVDSMIYTNQDKEIKELKDLALFLEKMHIHTEESKSSYVESKYLLKVKDTYLFHPVKFVTQLASKLTNIYENTPILKIEKLNDGYGCYTDKYKIKAQKVIVASHYPYFNFPFFFPIKAYLEKSYLCASPKKEESISLISYRNPAISIRSYKDYLIYLSNSHSIDKDTCDRKHYNELIKKIHDLGLSFEYIWSNIDIITNDGLPYVGEIKKNLYLATGYNTWGLTNGFLAGNIIADKILNKKNEYTDLFDPNRVNLEQIIGRISNVLRNIRGYIKSFQKNSNINYKKGMMFYQGKKFQRTCPHMGCKLLFNEVEKTFDCPCHGSRFDINGNPIMAPSNVKISNKS